MGLSTQKNIAYIQNIHRNGATIVWYSDVSENSEVKIGTTSGVYTNTYQDTTSVPLTQVGQSGSQYKHTVKIRGLLPNTKYYYSIGKIGTTYQATANNFFWTSPDTNVVQPIRIWAMADMGTSSGGGQAAVVTGFNAFNGSNKVDLMFQVGDLCYDSGLWNEFDARWFSSSPGYGSQLKYIPIYATAGNHDYGASGGDPTANLNNQPYGVLFNHPILNDAGGVASRDIRWYSFDYGHLHVISLDGWYYRNGADGLSMEPGSPQYNWLVNDLENFDAERTAGRKKWCILKCHFPAFSKGSHDSDNEVFCIGMRTFIAPLVYQYNIDLVLHGHSHGYERSYFINGFTGLDSAFNTSLYPVGNVAQVGLGNNSGAGNLPYNKTSGQVGAVFMVIGHGGKPSSSTYATQAGFPHNANIVSPTSGWGSVVIDITSSGGAHTMRVRTIAATSGSVYDEFYINRA